jgi:hypothetical protein
MSLRCSSERASFQEASIEASDTVEQILAEEHR